MATTAKTKAPGKKVKGTEARNTPVRDNEVAQRNRPTEEQIRRKAQELYYQRLNRGEYGTEIDDWQKAEQLLTED